MRPGPLGQLYLEEINILDLCADGADKQPHRVVQSETGGATDPARGRERGLT